MECFYKSSDYPGSKFKKDRRSQFTQGGQQLGIDELQVVRSSSTEVVFIDRGSWRNPKGRTYKHEKVVLLRMLGGKWLVTVEASRKTNKCFEDVFSGQVRSKKKGASSCRSGLKNCFRKCDADRSASPNREMLCLSSCQDEYTSCSGAPVPKKLRRLDFDD